jgi:hypothetical protein
MSATQENGGASAAVSGSVYRDAFRLLCILVRGSVPLPEEEASSEFDKVFQGEKRALAIDFWVRYPDYLAEKLLDLHDEGEPGLLDEIGRIFDEDEPSVHLVKMVRWRHGAYEDLQTFLGVLSFRGLVRPIRKSLPSGRPQHDYHVGPAAEALLIESFGSQPALTWYDKQTALAMRVAGGKAGSALKDAHYEVPEYASTPYGSVIPSIKERVMLRYKKAASENLG